MVKSRGKHFGQDGLTEVKARDGDECAVDGISRADNYKAPSDTRICKKRIYMRSERSLTDFFKWLYRKKFIRRISIRVLDKIGRRVRENFPRP